MAIFYFVSFFVFQLLWDFDNFLFDLVYPFLAIIITSISSFHMWHNTTTVRGSINFYLYVNFSYSYSRRFIHYLVYLSRLTSEKGKNFSKDTKWHSGGEAAQLQLLDLPCQHLLSSMLFFQDYPLWMSGTFFWVLFPVMTWLTGQKLKLRMDKKRSCALWQCVIYHKSKPNSEEFCLNSNCKLFVNYS